MAMGENFCLRWNNFESNISVAFRELRDDKDFFDVTLACDENQIQAHKVILSACSPFFRTVLKRNKHDHPLLYLKGVKYSDIVAVLNFMYHGEVNVAQEELNSFLSVAEDLQVKGLTQNNSQASENTAPTVAEISKKTGVPSQATQKRTRPPPAPAPRAPPPRFHPNDDLQENVPIKSEPTSIIPEPQPNLMTEVAPAEEEYASPVLEQAGVVADPDMEEYGDYGDYGEYDGYEDNGSYGSGTMHSNADGVAQGGLDGNKDLDVLISESMSRAIVGGVSVWKCHLCQRSSKDKSIIRRHIESHFPGCNECPYCGQPSKTRRSLQMHILNHHGPKNVQ